MLFWSGALATVAEALIPPLTLLGDGQPGSLEIEAVRSADHQPWSPHLNRFALVRWPSTNSGRGRVAANRPVPPLIRGLPISPSELSSRAQPCLARSVHWR